jgi:hypothetical protein
MLSGETASTAAQLVPTAPATHAMTAAAIPMLNLFTRFLSMFWPLT